MKTIQLANANNNFNPLSRQLNAIYTNKCPCYTHFRLVEKLFIEEKQYEYFIQHYRYISENEGRN